METRAVNPAQYDAGRDAGGRDAKAGEYRPQDHNGRPADFRQGYVDGWETTRDATDPVFDGYTRDQLQAAFNLVKDPANWKLAVDAVVPDGTDLHAVESALLFYCGSPPDILRVDGGHRVIAAGYYACIGS
jgi:hypothetical protein